MTTAREVIATKCDELDMLYPGDVHAGDFILAALEQAGWVVVPREIPEALTSIAKNTCCEPCREAGLVAKAALNKSSQTASSSLDRK